MRRENYVNLPKTLSLNLESTINHRYLLERKAARISDKRNILLDTSFPRKEITNYDLPMYIKDLFFLYKYIFSVNKDSMTDFRNQSNRKRERVYLSVVLSGSTSEMYLFFTKILFVFSVYDGYKALGHHEKEEQFMGRDEGDGLISNKNGTPIWTENDLATLIQQQPLAIVVELRESLLMNLKASLAEENNTNFPIRSTLLATFDSKGLQDVYLLNDTFEIRQAIMDLQPTNFGSEIPTPTIYILGELLSRGLHEGFVLLVTMSRPSDELFGPNLITSLEGRNCQLSVLWAGNYPSDEYLLLKDVADTTGGKFGYLTNDSNSDESSTEHYYPKSEFENLEKIKFPEQQLEISGEAESPPITRAAGERVVQKTVVPLIVEVASGSSLEARPGTSTQIQFNVKNNVNVPLLVIYNAKFNGVMQNVQPHQTLIPPSAMVTVIVNLQPFGPSQAVNALGTLTLAATTGPSTTVRSALISMTPQTITDNYAPKMSHRYEGDCSNYKEPQNCDQGHWSLEVTVHDEDSGLLKVLSEPYGLLFHSQFVAGTKTPTTVYYTATCCQPHVIIWAEDLKGNYVKKSFDVFNQNLLAGEIASIVLGVLIILFVIIAIIVAIILIKRRNQRNLIIPRARSGSR